MGWDKGKYFHSSAHIHTHTYSYKHTEKFKYTHVQTYWFVVKFEMYVLVLTPTPKFLLLQCVHVGLYLQEGITTHLNEWEEEPWIILQRFLRGNFHQWQGTKNKSKLKKFLCSDVNISWSMVSAKDLPTDCVKLYRVMTISQPITIVNVTTKVILCVF